MATLLILVTTLVYVLAEGLGTTQDKLSDNDGGGQEESVLILADIATNHSLPCGQGFLTQNRPVMWGRQGYGFAQNAKVQPDGSLFFTNLQLSNAGLYSCQDDFFQDNSPIGEKQSKPFSIKTWYQLKVRTAPLPLQNVTVLASTILASVMWEIGNDGGYPISSFHIRYRLKNDTDADWTHCQPDLISPMQRHWDVFHLCPKSLYVFEIWANNRLGKGVSTVVEVETHNDLEEIQVGRYLLEGMDTFDTRIWIAAVGVVLGTLCILGLATCCLLYKEYYSARPGRSMEPIRRRSNIKIPSEDGDEEIELIPNIIFNPVFDLSTTAGPGHPKTDQDAPRPSCSSSNPTRLQPKNPTRV